METAADAEIFIIAFADMFAEALLFMLSAVFAETFVIIPLNSAFAVADMEQFKEV